jgi:hypothetical protein
MMEMQLVLAMATKRLQLERVVRATPDRADAA